MALDMFLQIDGIHGDTRDVNHPGALDVLAWSWGLSHSPPTGTSAPKANLQDLSFTTYEGLYSPMLFKAIVLGSLIKSATLSIVKSGSTTPTTADEQFQLTGVRLTALSTGGSGGEDRLTSNVTMDFQTVRYTVNDTSTSPPTTSTYGWSVPQNKPI